MKRKLALSPVASALFLGPVGLFLSLFVAPTLSAHAQSVSAATDSTGTVVNVHETAEGSQFTVEQGSLSADNANLFHSFEAFSLEVGESANFLAPPSVQNIFGRVNGGVPSVLNGLLQVTSAGPHEPNLFLMNPAGVLFGAEAVLNLPANLTVTSADGIGFSQGWFSAVGENSYASLTGAPSGAFAFLSEQPGSVVNAGNLTLVDGAAVALLGGTVVNTGTISAPGGSATLAAISGNNVVRLSQENSLLSLELQASNQLLDSTMGGLNAPTFTPLDLPALLTYGDETHATGLSVGADGSVRLTSTNSLLPMDAGDAIASGTLTVDSDDGQGGQIAVVGDRVLAIKAQLLASGLYGGGSLRLGGDYQGRGPLLSASRTFVGARTLLAADALFKGDGGRVILWANDTTGFWGDISVRGGETAGDGGFVEVSGQQNLTFQGRVSTVAPQGRAGMLLLDPETIVIRPGISAPNDGELIDGIINATDEPPRGGPQESIFYISEDALESIDGNTDIILQASENILFEDLDDDELRFQPGIGEITILAPGMVFAEDQSDEIVAPRRSINIIAGQVVLGDISNAPISGLPVFNGADIEIETVYSPLVSDNSISVGDLTTAGNVLNEPGSVVLTTSDHPDTLFGNIVTGDIFTGDPNNSTAAGSGGDVVLIAGAGGDIFTGDIEAIGSAIILTDGDVNTGFVTMGASSSTGSEASVDDDFFDRDFFDEDDFFEGEFFGEDEFLDDGGPFGGQNLLSLDDEGEDAVDNGDDIEADLELDALEGPDGVDGPREDGGYEVKLTELDLGIVDDVISEVDGANNEDFSTYLGLDVSSEDLTLEEIQVMLTNIETQSGNRSAVVYINMPQAASVAMGAIEKEQSDFLDNKQAEPSGRDALRSSQEMLEIILITAEGVPVKADVSGVTRSQLLQTIEKFRGDIVSSARRGSDYYRPTAQQLYQWLIAPIEAELGSAAIETLVFSMDEGLRTLPMAALHDGEQFLVEKYSLGMVPSMSLLDAQYEPVNDAQVLAMGASRFEHLSPLPAVPLELELINELWSGSAFLNETFTRQTLIEQRQQSPYRLIHLATHAEFQSGSADNSYIQLWDEKLKLSELDRFGWEYPAVDLLVLSACSTAVGSPEAEMGFAGLAVASGVRSAMASLWSVSDVGTLALMSEFYGDLQLTSTKAEALRAAQLSMLNGDVRTQGGELMRSAARGGLPLPSELDTLGESDFSHPYYWSGFTMIGSPW